MENYRKIRADKFKLCVHRHLADQWLEDLIASLDRLPPVPYAPNRRRGFVKLPDACPFESAFVKVYAHTDCQARGFRRTHPLRRLLPRYASKEGKTYLKFQHMGLSVPTVLAFGEEWKYGIRGRGLFIVENIQAPSLQMLLHDACSGERHDWIERLFRTIADLHRAGVTHGDAHLVNFLGIDRTIYSIDIDKSKPVSPKRCTSDLINVMTGILLETSDTKIIEHGLDRYGSQGRELPSAKDAMISIARKKSLNIGEKDRARYYGPMPPSIEL